jgi:hypothetical protein
MKGTALPIIAVAVALAVVAAGGALASRRQRDLELSPLPSVENTGPRGLAAARMWLAATGRPHRVIGVGDAPPMPGEVLLLVAPPGAVGERDAAAIMAHAERGGLVVWAVGERSQPPLERRLGVQRAGGASDFTEQAAFPLAPHPIFEGVVLRTGGSSLRASSDLALPVAGEHGDERTRVSAVAVAVGAGEAIVLAGPEPLENFRLGDAGNLSLLSRLSALGVIAFDERHLATATAPAMASSGGALLLAAQALLVATILLLALGRRLGAVRVAVLPQAGRSARDYLASLGELYRRAGGDVELRASTWRTLRKVLERRGGIPVGASDDEAERRLAGRFPDAANAFSRGRAALQSPPGEAGLVALMRASAETEAALQPRHPGARVRIR